MKLYDENVKTVSGKHLIFHMERCPFAKNSLDIPLEFLKEWDATGGSWFFMESDGCKTVLGEMRGYPLIYSPAFKTPEEALAAAETWETEKAKIQRGWEEAEASCKFT